MTDVLDAQRVTKRFGGLVAVNSIDFTIPEKSIVSLIGPNGAGKTTFFNIIAGIYDPSAGRIEFLGEPMIAKAQRAWLEPVLWLIPAAIATLLTYLLATVGAPQAMVIVGLFLTVITPLVVIGVGAARPLPYPRPLGRLRLLPSA